MEGIEKKQAGFHWVDYLIFVVFILISIGFGVFAQIRNRFKKQTAEDFLAGSRDLSLLPVTLAILSSLLSAIMITGTPAEVYLQGTQIFMMAVGMAVGSIVASHIFVPMLYPLKLTSTNEYFEMRYHSKWPKLFATGLLIMQQLLNMGIATYAPATSLESLTGFPTWMTILIGGMVAVVYTALGGLKASVWAGAFQTVIMAAGVIAVIVKGSIDVGGIAEVWRINEAGKRVQFFNFDPNPLVRHSFWSLVVGVGVSYIFQFGINPASVQRYSAMPTETLAKWTVVLNIPGMIIFMVLVCLAGMVIYAYYAMVKCDPLTSGYVDNPNQLVAYFVMDRIGYPGVPGLFLASLFSGSLSTVSATLSALAALTYQDIIRPFLPAKLPVHIQTWITQGLVVFYGLVGIGTAFLAATLGGTVLQAALSFVGATGGPILGMFILATFFPCSHWQGAIIGAVISLGFCLWLSFGSYILGAANPLLNTTTEMCLNATLANVTSGGFTPDDVVGFERFYLISYLWYPSIGTALVVIVALLISCVTGGQFRFRGQFCIRRLYTDYQATCEASPVKQEGLDDPKNVPMKYTIPICDKFCCCLPNQTLKILRCNRDLTADEKEEAGELLSEEPDAARAAIFSVGHAIPVGKMSYANHAVDITPL